MLHSHAMRQHICPKNTNLTETVYVQPSQSTQKTLLQGSTI